MAAGRDNTEEGHQLERNTDHNKLHSVLSLPPSLPPSLFLYAYSTHWSALVPARGSQAGSRPEGRPAAEGRWLVAGWGRGPGPGWGRGPAAGGALAACRQGRVGEDKHSGLEQDTTA